MLSPEQKAKLSEIQNTVQNQQNSNGNVSAESNEPSESISESKKDNFGDSTKKKNGISIPKIDEKELENTPKYSN